MLKTAAYGRSKAGFTLIEFTVVIFILALLAAVTVPRLTAFFSKGDIEAFSSKLSTYIEHLRDESIYKKEGFYLQFDHERKSFYVTSVKGKQNREVLMRPLSLPEGIEITDFVLGQGDKIYEGEVKIPFFPGGTAQPTLIHVKGRDGKEMTIAISYLARKVKRHEGYLEKK